MLVADQHGPRSNILRGAATPRRRPQSPHLFLRRDVPAPSRASLLCQNNCWIIEDDCDSEFRYQGHPIASVHGLDKAGCVLNTGTFSKALLPSFRIGYLVAPADLVPAFRAVRPAVDRCPPSFQQRVIADFLEEGYFRRICGD